MRLRILIPFVILATIPAAAQQDDRRPTARQFALTSTASFRRSSIRTKRKLRATHHQNWLGYLEGSRTMI
jgi:hypothetical protein